MFEVIAFDGDDTLWHNESIFSVTEQRFHDLLAAYVPDAAIDKQLFATEIRNLAIFGYGIKGFTLSMIETAIEVTEGRITAADIQEIIDSGKAMLQHPVELLDDVSSTLMALADRYRLILITKGDLFDQESKIARSGLSELFWQVSILSEKNTSAYDRLLGQYNIGPENFLMVGNSLRSDILPVLELGATAVHIPYHLTWAHERAECDDDRPRLYRLERIGDLPGLVERLSLERVAL